MFEGFVKRMIDFNSRSMVVFPKDKLIEFHYFDSTETETYSSFLPISELGKLVEDARSLMGNRMVYKDYHLGNYVIEHQGRIYIFSFSIKDCNIKVVLNISAVM